jgi:hypothetical protein
MDAVTAMELATIKWRDFVQRFLPELEAAQFTEEQLSTKFDTIATYITLGWIYRGAIDDKDEATLRVIVEASDLTNKVALLSTWDEMSVEKKATFWRFARWFFNTVLC